MGKAEGVLPREEQIRNETYTVNNRYIFFLKEIGTNRAGYSRIVLSRTAPELIIELFKKEVPEIANGTVEIRKVVRDPGERAKIAVFSSQSGVDPVGACVGQKGVRVQTVTDELNGQEKIDIIQWNENPKIYIVSALSPAKVISVDIDEKAQKAKVTVEESQAPLAIGKGGVNVNLAARLAGYEIDIVQIETPESKKEKAAKAELKAQEKAAGTEKIAEEAPTDTSSSETPEEAPAEVPPQEEAAQPQEVQGNGEEEKTA
jgi:N utilization substance protein A